MNANQPSHFSTFSLALLSKQSPEKSWRVPPTDVTLPTVEPRNNKAWNAQGVKRLAANNILLTRKRNYPFLLVWIALTPSLDQMIDLKQLFCNNRVRYNVPLLKGYVNSMFYIPTKFIFLRRKDRKRDLKQPGKEKTFSYKFSSICAFAKRLVENRMQNNSDAIAFKLWLLMT